METYGIATWVVIDTDTEGRYHLYHGVPGVGFQFRGHLSLTPAEAADLRARLGEVLTDGTVGCDHDG